MKTMKYIPKDIEKKWQEKWDKDGVYHFDENDTKNKFYTLVELPYPSGDLHIGHWFTFVTPDVLSRYHRMNGVNVFYPHGYDAFGLPAENAAIKRKIHPKDWTMKNIETMQAQFKTMGSMMNLTDLVITCEPEYYRWNQWIFLKMYEKGIAYRGTAISNWCPFDKTVLADEHVEGGKCWRCGNTIERKEVAQWFLKITEYADRLLWPDFAKASTGKNDKPSVDWPISVRVGQNQWIGKSEGLLIKFDEIEVFTTKPETVDGATFVVLAPEHELVGRFTTDEHKKEVEDYVKKANSKSELERKENKEKTGVFTGSSVKNPVTGKKIPVWVADYVLVGYGTGAIMAVPAADERDREFAEKFKLPIEKTSFKANPEGQKKVNYHIRDWSISRQRYWGTPVPIIHCDACGVVPVPEKDLPIELPYDVDFTPTGKPPLATNEKWLKTKCPKCGKDAKREAETLDTFFDSSWYYYRYVSPHDETSPFDKSKVDSLMPIDVYFGGAEHTLGHTLYARFFTKFFKDLGLVPFDEFASKRIQHGIVLGPDGNKMSKSKGNVINPDDVVKEFGVDTVRLYLCFMMPYEGTAPWSTEAIQGMYRFLQRVWKLSEKVMMNDELRMTNEDLYLMHKTIRNVGRDIKEIKCNTAIAFIMEWLNYLSRKSGITNDELRIMLLLLAPFAPHITEEMWHQIGEKNSIHLEKWPEYDEKYITSKQMKIPVQVNGKLRTVLSVISDQLSEESVVEMAKKDPKVIQYLEGKKYTVRYIEGKILNFILE